MYVYVNVNDCNLQYIIASPMPCLFYHIFITLYTIIIILLAVIHSFALGLLD